jgi:hypothetical protein
MLLWSLNGRMERGFVKKEFDCCIKDILERLIKC